MTGYEVLKIQSAIDCLMADRDGFRPLGIMGHGEGGRLALFAAALDERIDSIAVSGAFGPREQLWKEPADRNVFGLLREFGDAELAGLIAPRPLVIEHGTDPAYGYRAAGGQLVLDFEQRAPIPGKPGLLPSPSDAEVSSEAARLKALVPIAQVDLVKSTAPLSDAALSRLLEHFQLTGTDPVQPPTDKILPSPSRTNELVLHNRLALIDAAADRARYFANLKTDSLENFEKTMEPYREKFRTDVIGDFELPLLPPNVRTRPYQVGDKTLSYEVVMDVMESGGETVIAYGILTLPKDLDLSSGEKRPVVVCQHGLEGTPQDLIGEAKHDAYKAYATRLAERGFITFAPQNGYKYFDLFRMQQFKAQSIGKTLFSIIVPQHRQITDWLAAQPWVDPDKIAFYGLSYGGKSAMRIPPLVDRYCLSICSADFNEWVWKNAATDEASLRYSYANKGEYEIFEWNLGGTFNYAEMAALICPRPFMVERGHFDGVGPDEQVAFEFAKVRNLYQAKLGLADRCEIEWFVGPHAINGVGTYDFLHRHLAWPRPEE
jgi:dienelactone hydrolase